MSRHASPRPASRGAGNLGKTWAWPGQMVGLIYTLFGADMVLQPDRFSRTPAYANLTGVLDIEIWGGLYLLAAGLLAAYLTVLYQRRWAIIVHGYALTLTGVWLLAFVIRWVTDSSTTVVNVGSWLGFMLALLLSGTLIDTSAATRRRDGDGP